MADPLDIDTIEQLKFITNCEIKPMITTFGELQDAIRGIIDDFNLSDSPLQRFIEKYARPVEGAVKEFAAISKTPHHMQFNLRMAMILIATCPLNLTKTRHRK